MNEATLLDLFSGYGGFSLAAEQCGIRTIGFSEIEPYPCRILAERFPGIPNLGDVRTITRSSVLERTGCLPSIISAGVPCQPASTAGKRKGASDERWLWGEFIRLLGELRPCYAIGENVPGIFSVDGGLAFNRIISDLAAIRYACLWQVVSAADIGAPHRRERVWLLCVDELAHAGHRAGSPEQFQQRDQSAKESVGLCNVENSITSGSRSASGDALHEGRGTGATGAEGLPTTTRWKAGAAISDDKSTGGHGAKGVGLADSNGAGWREQWSTESAQAQQSAVERGGFEWPAASGLWPSGPGQPQHEWEPRRVVDDTPRKQCHGRQEPRGLHAESDGAGEAVAVGANNERERGRIARNGRGQSSNGGEGKVIAGLGRDFNGPPRGLDSDARNRTARLKSIGNGIVPQVAEIFFRAILNHEKNLSKL